MVAADSDCHSGSRRLRRTFPLVVSCICIAAAGVVFVLAFRPKYVTDNVSLPRQPAAAAH